MGQPVSAGSANATLAYASLACDMTSASEVAVAAWGALQVLYAFAFDDVTAYTLAVVLILT